MWIEKLNLLRNQADGFEDFELEFADLLFRRTGVEELFLAGALLCRELRCGRIGLDIDKFGGTDLVCGNENIVLPQKEEWKAALTSEKCSGTVALDPTDPIGELLLLDDRRLMMRRYYVYEKFVSEKLLKKRQWADTLSVPADFPENNADLQDLAVFCAFNSRLLILSGGPGTGKTTVSGRIMKELLTRDPGLKIALAAPTGKAQQRLNAQIAENAGKLPPDDPVRELMSRLNAATIHSMIYNSTSIEMLQQCDLLIIDECSMVPLWLFYRLLTLLPEQASLILIGDRRQLAPLGSGSVFADICSGGIVNELPKKARDFFAQYGETLPEADAEHPFSGMLVELQKNYRSASAPNICSTAEMLRDLQDDQVKNAAEYMMGMSADDMLCRSVTADNCEKELKKIFKHVIYNGKALNDLPEIAASGDHNAALALAGKIKILCAVNEGKSGVEHFNDLSLKLLGIKPHQDGLFLAGTVILITENDSLTGLRNGDIGVVVANPQSGELNVRFESMPEKVFLQSELPANGCGFALSVHKAQGSGYDNILFVLPEKHNKVLTPELIYTGVTRAAKKLEIWSGADILEQALKNRAERSSELFLNSSGA